MGNKLDTSSDGMCSHPAKHIDFCISTNRLFVDYCISPNSLKLHLSESLVIRQRGVEKTHGIKEASQ